MAKTKRQNEESDGAYVLKLVLYLILGTQWLFIKSKTGSQTPIPYGVVAGLFFAAHEHFQIDRKIEYAVLMVAMFIGFFAQVGLTYSL